MPLVTVLRCDRDDCITKYGCKIEVAFNHDHETYGGLKDAIRHYGSCDCAPSATQTWSLDETDPGQKGLKVLCPGCVELDKVK